MRQATILAVVVFAAAAQPLLAQQQPGAGLGGTASTAPGNPAGAGTVQLVGTVEAVDTRHRSLTVKGPKGSLQTMTVSEHVRNLAQVKVGDRVSVTYAQALALEFKKVAAGIRERIESEVGPRAATSGHPMGGAGREVSLLADVAVVNYIRQTVTLRNPKQIVTLAVPDAAQLRSLTTGEKVHAIYTEALAIAMRAAPGTSSGE